MKNNKVIFIPGSQLADYVGISPKPSKNYIPKWLKEMSQVQLKGNGFFGPTAKKCMPFMDSFLTGYTQELICDVEIIYNGKDNDGNDLIKYIWHGDIRPISSRQEDSMSEKTFSNFDGFYNFEPHWITQWEPKTPSGYSTLYTHPLNRPDLPFYTLSGIIDTDSWQGPGPLGFLIKRGFQGIIPAGTPIYQMFFIKREIWNSEKTKYDERYQTEKIYKIKRFAQDGYKKIHWSRKEYR